MRILIDKAIADAPGLFSPYGDIISASGITPELVSTADVAIVRSVTKVDKELLSQAKNLRFVGSPTAGINHLDQEELRKHGICWAAAPGSNATAIADYTLSGLVIAGILAPICRGEKTLALVGGGYAAAAIAARIKSCGELVGRELPVYCYDPFVSPEQLRRRGLTAVSLAKLLTCDCISIHCALTQASYHLFNSKVLRKLKSNCLLINTARGQVIEPAPLSEYANEGRKLIMDVWNHEPRPDPDLIRACLIATPHIAGYSRMGKQLALAMVFSAFRRFQGIADKQPSSQRPLRYLAPWPQDKEELLNYAGRLLLFNYDPVRDSIVTKRIAELRTGEARGNEFTRLRRDYCLRREACEWQISHLPVSYRRIGAAISGQ